MAGSEELGQLKVLLSAQTAEYIQDLEKARGTSKQVGDDVKTSAGGISSAWGVLTAAGATTVAVLGAVAGATGYLIGEASAAQEAQAQLNAVLASTGGVAGVTADMANELAGAYQNVTRYSDEEILSAESLMLTFTNISSEVFPQALGVTLDLATALKMDLQGATTMVSKALNVQAGDTAAATTAMNAMRRSGRVFTSEQIDLAKQMIATGDVMGYQQLIMKELQTEYGGSAAAAGGTLAGAQDILNNKLSDVAETWGGALLPVAQDFVENVTPILIDSLNVLTQTELPAFVELVGKASGALLTAVEAGALLITWNERIDAAYQQQNTTLLQTTDTYAEYQAGIIAAGEAMGQTAVFTDELTAKQAETMDAIIGLTEAQYNAVTSGMELEDQDKKLALAYSTYAVAAGGAALATDGVSTSEDGLITQSGLLKDALATLATEGLDPAAAASKLLQEGIDLATDSMVEAERLSLVLAIAEKTRQLNTEDLTDAEKKQLSTELELLFNQQSELENMDKLNELLRSGQIDRYDWIEAMADGVVTQDEVNGLLGVQDDLLIDVNKQINTMPAYKKFVLDVEVTGDPLPNVGGYGGGAPTGPVTPTASQTVDPSPGGGATRATGRGGATVIIQNLYLQADDAYTLIEQLYALNPH